MTVTAQTKDTTQICIPVVIARQIAEDLVKGDEALEQVQTLQQTVDLQNSLIHNQDSIIQVHRKSLVISQERITDLQNQIQNGKILEESLRGKVRRNRAYAISFGCFTVLSVAGIVTIFALR